MQEGKGVIIEVREGVMRRRRRRVWKRKYWGEKEDIGGEEGERVGRPGAVSCIRHSRRDVTQALSENFPAVLTNM